MKIKKNQKGFTLVEMIVVIAIIAVLAAMMVPSLLGYIERANVSNNRAAATNIGRMAQAVLAEMNNTSITGEYNGSGPGNADVTVTPSVVGPQNTEFATRLGKMFDQNFKGYFKVVVTSGSNVKAYYRKDQAPAVGVTTSNKEQGVYPES